jgi:3-phenylpropionate/trans-cinnamate dioxygenase ferredoxin reductase component
MAISLLGAANLGFMSTCTATAARSRDGIVIAGGGLAGQRCAESLRRGGYEHAIKMVCSEPRRPYDRPPLSKELLSDRAYDDRLPYRPERWYEDQSVDLLLGVRAAALDHRAHRLTLSDGAKLRYERLLICTGSRPRTLPLLASYPNVSVLRTVDDAMELREVLGGRPRLAVIGAGFIGLEIAASARRLGADVTVVEAAPFPFSGVLGPRVGSWFAELHRAEGVDVRTGVAVDRVRSNAAVRDLRLSDGSVVAVDHVLVGAGVQPDVAWLADSGLDASRGVPVNADGRTAIEDVFAAGDAAARFDSARGRYVSGSHWEAAARQGMRAGRAMLGLDPGPTPVSSFWTDQYGLRIQYVGNARPGDCVEIDGDPNGRNFTAIFTRDGRAVAAVLVDRPRALPATRELLEKGTRDGLPGTNR